MVLLLAGVVSLGGWVLVAPAMPKPGAVAVEPALDLGEPRVPPGRAEASAAARVKPDAAARVASSTSIGAAGGAGNAPARCGDDEAPVYADPVPDEDGIIRSWPVQTRSAGVGYVGAQRRVDAALRATGDPFDAAVADALNVGDLRSPDDRLAALVQDAVVGDDARTYQLAFTACNGVQLQGPATFAGGPPIAGEAGLRSCARLDPRRWAARDPGNAVPWFHVLVRADAQGDGAGQREALQQLAAASRFDMGYAQATAAVARLRMPGDADLAGQSFLATKALAFELWPPFSGVTQRCRDQAGGDAAMVAICERIADVLFDHSDGLMPRNVGASIHKLATGDASRLDQAHGEVKELGALHETLNRQEPPADASTCEAPRRFLRRLVLIAKVGESEAVRQEIAAHSVK
jgi:hypothetical protein